MHPTADTRAVINLCGAARRVIGGVMPPLRVPAKMQAAFAPMNAADGGRYPRGAGAADLSHSVGGIRVAGAGGGNDALRHNKRMHATRDTLLVI